MSDPEDPANPASEPVADPAVEPAAGPVAEAQADAQQAQTDADKALADPQADLQTLLDGLRTIEVQLFGIEVVQQVQQLSGDDKQAFVSARIHLTSVINQLNMISGFLAHGTVRSFYGPMLCTRCSRETSHLFTTRECRDHDGLPPVDCSSCGSPMGLDELEDSYLLFLREPTMVAPDP